MGNRAIITSHPFDAKNVGIYVHWNGGRASIEGFCQAARELGYRDPVSDRYYGLARLTQAIGLFFGDASLGIGRVKDLDSENGVYVVGKDWQIVERRRFPTTEKLLPADWEEEVDAGKTAEIAEAIKRRTAAATAVTEEPVA